MKGQIRSGLKLAAVFLGASIFGFAQPNVSASGHPEKGLPGTINYVEGQAELNGQALGSGSAGSAVAQPNATIDTQAGYVEVLLAPGAFLRIGHNSEVVTRSLGLTDIQLQVVRGNAMVEADDFVKGSTMEVAMGNATAQIDKRGLYDFDANQNAVKVLDGKAKISEASSVKEIGKDHEILLADNPKLKPQDFNKKSAEADQLYVWSNARSQAQAQENVNLAKTIVVNGGWYGPGWYWDPFWANYAFIPGAGYLYSPFGWGFYSPGFVYAAPFYRGGYYVRGGHLGGFAAYRGAVPHAAFAGGGFHGGGRR
jgi:hypothetical protein